MALSRGALAAINAAMKARNVKLARAVADSRVPWEQVSPAGALPDRVLKAAAKAGKDSIRARSLDLESRLLKRWQSGRPVPDWFIPFDSNNSLLQYNIGRARAGLMSADAPFPKARAAAAYDRSGPDLGSATVRNRKVREAVPVSSLPVDLIEKAQRICGVYSNPLVCRKVSAMLENQIPNARLILGSFKGRQHAWNTLSDGTVVDATASQFGLPFLNVVPKVTAKKMGYRAHPREKVDKFNKEFRSLTSRSANDLELQLAREFNYDAKTLLRNTGEFYDDTF